jgi:hypothetical protein
MGFRQSVLDLPGWVRSLTSHPIVRDGVEIRLAYDAIAKLAGAETRLGEILHLVQPRNLSEQALTFLSRAAQLYLWGLEPEAVVMCGAALEAAYVERFPDRDMKAIPIERVRGRYTAVQYEDAAVRLQIFSRQQAKMAYDIRRARNDAVHPNSQRESAPTEVLVQTSELLSSLFPPSEA